ncbi:MAG: aldo/keto reductase [Devosia sp.]|uniref:aldo/keto reductase n=1 Tax=Devosia sp. TaxID=1871048 RepID=UPI001A606124|nr:aldo/keto reductase [Devosia sp.]
MKVDLNTRRRLGRSALEVPPLGFGAAHLGGMYSRVSSAAACDTLAAAWGADIRYFDTAPYYGLGLSEMRVGNFLVDKPRASYVLTTKVGRTLKHPDDLPNFDRTPWQGGLNREVVFDFTYDGVMRSYEQSLHRLGVDYIDALLIHDPDASLGTDVHTSRMRDMATSGIRALEELKKSSLISAIGMGLNAAESLTEIAPLVPLDFCIVAMPYTLLDQSALQTGLKRCVEQEISVIIGAPFASGILATGPGPNAKYRYGPAEPEIQEKVAKIMSVCDRHHVPLPAAALQFPLAHPSVVCVIPGGMKAEEVVANVHNIGVDIDGEFWRELRELNLIDPEAPTPT